MQRNYKNVYTLKSNSLNNIMIPEFNEIKRKSIESCIIYPFANNLRKFESENSISVFQNLIFKDKDKNKILAPSAKLKNNSRRIHNMVIFHSNNNVKEIYGYCHSHIRAMSSFFERKTLQ